MRQIGQAISRAVAATAKEVSFRARRARHRARSMSGGRIGRAPPTRLTPAGADVRRQDGPGTDMPGCRERRQVRADPGAIMDAVPTPVTGTAMRAIPVIRRGGRSRKRGIVALARKPLVAPVRYPTVGSMQEGTVLSREGKDNRTPGRLDGGTGESERACDRARAWLAAAAAPSHHTGPVPPERRVAPHWVPWSRVASAGRPDRTGVWRRRLACHGTRRSARSVPTRSHGCGPYTGHAKRDEGTGTTARSARHRE